MIRQTEWTGCQGCGYFQKLLDIPAESVAYAARQRGGEER